MRRVLLATVLAGLVLLAFALPGQAATVMKSSVAAENAHNLGSGGWGGWGGGYAYDWYGSRYYSGNYYNAPYYYSNWSWGRPYYYSSWGWNRPYYSYYSYPTYSYYSYPSYSYWGFGYPSYAYSYPSYYYSYAPSSAIVYEEPSSSDMVRSQSFYRAPTGSTQALLRVLVPSTMAAVFIEDQPTLQLGTDRLFISPPLDANATYAYTVKARWMENGQEMTKEKTVNVSPGSSATVNFMADRPEQVPVPGRSDDRLRGSNSERYIPPSDSGAIVTDNLIQGTILRVDSNDVVVSLSDGTQRTFHLAGTSGVIFLDGQPTEIRNLQPGMSVRATMRSGAAPDAAPMRFEVKKAPSNPVRSNDSNPANDRTAPDRTNQGDRPSPPPQ